MPRPLDRNGDEPMGSLAERLKSPQQARSSGNQPRQRAANDGGQIAAFPIVNQVLNSSGRTLDAATRAFTELRFAHDFSQVRVHVDDRAARPLLQRAPIPGWNFTPSDFTKLQSAGKDLSIAKNSGWFPAKLQENLLNTLRLLLGPKISPSGTEGVNALDFFHGHLVVDKKDLLLDAAGKQRPPEQAMKHADDFERQQKKATARALGGQFKETPNGPLLSFGGKYPVTASNLPAFTAAIEKLLPAFGSTLEEGAKVPGAAVMYHTFEFTTPGDLAAKGQQINFGDPRRHYVTPLDTNAPRQYTPPPGGYETEYVVINPFSFLVDSNGEVHVRPFEAGGGFTSLDLSTITGTPFAGEPFPVVGTGP